MAKLPPDHYILIYGCPDGENHSSNIANQAIAQIVRQKGHFDLTFIAFATKSIRNAEQRLVLVDVGGVRSPENEKIFKECDGYVILSSTPEEISLWREFGDRLGLKCLAELDSRLSEEKSVIYPDQSDGILRGLVVGLERGETIMSPVIDALTEKFICIITENSEITLAEQVADINGVKIADQVGITDRSDPFLGYRPWHLAPALQAVKNLVGQPQVKIWNMRAFWVVSALCVMLRRSVVELFDVSNGYVSIPNLKPKKSGSEIGLAWDVMEMNDYTIVNFKIVNDIYNISALHLACPPAVNPNKGVIISGVGPIVLLATIARAYGNVKHPFIAMFAPAESGRGQNSLEGRRWDEVYPKSGPCVEIVGKNIGRLIPVSAEMLKFYGWKLADGTAVVDRQDSHLASHLKTYPVLGRMLPEALRQVIPTGQQFQLAEVQMGVMVGKSICVATSTGDEIIFAQRPNRQGLTRFVKNRESEDSSKISVVLKKAEEGNFYILLSAFIGGLTPPEPWDKFANSESLPFWNSHALIWGQEEIVAGTEINNCPW